MRQPIFFEFQDPYPRLIEAVKDVRPEIPESIASPVIVELVQSCLVKDPDIRARIVTWESFDLKSRASITKENLRARILRRATATRGSSLVALTDDNRKVFLDDVLEGCLRSCRTEIIKEAQVFPPLELIKETPHQTLRGLSIIFEPSNSPFLSWHQLVSFEIELLSGEEHALSITAISSVSLTKDMQPDKIFASPVEIYTGVYNASLVNEAMIGLLYVAIDEAQGITNLKKATFLKLAIP